MRVIIIILFGFSSISLLSGQRSYWFVEVSSQDSTEYALEFGQFIMADGEISKQKSQEITSIDDFILEIQDHITEKNWYKPDQFIYIHGMWGHQNWYQKNVLQTMEESMFIGDKPEVVISFIWHSGIHYYDNVKHALQVGKFFFPVLDQLLNMEHESSQILMHSMGNRVFQGMYSRMKKDQIEEPLFDQMYFVAADLEVNVFEENQPLYGLGNITKEANIYVHNNDRSLGMSKSLNDNLRLGLNADSKICTVDSCLYVIDVSTISDNEGFAPSLSNHRYFYTSPTVRNDLKLSINGKDNNSRTTLDHPRRLQLNSVEN